MLKREKERVVPIGIGNERAASGINGGERLAADGAGEGVAEVGERVRVEESEESEAEDVSRREVGLSESGFGAEEERMEPPKVVVHLLPPAHLFLSRRRRRHAVALGLLLSRHFLFALCLPVPPAFPSKTC